MSEAYNLNLFPAHQYKTEEVVLELSALPENKELISPEPNREFIEDLDGRGLLVPIEVTPLAGGGYYVLTGRRRIKAARKLGWTEIKARVVYDVPPEEYMAWATAENSKRTDNPLMDLDAIKHYAELNYDETKIALLTGLPKGTVRSRLKLLRVKPALMDAAKEGKITPSALQEASKLSSAQQAELETKLQEKGKLSSTDVSALKQIKRTEASQTAILNMALPPIQTVILFVVMHADGTLSETFKEKAQAALGEGDKLFRLIPA